MKATLLFTSIFLALLPHISRAQCATSGTPSYSSAAPGCASEYLTSVTASGAGVVSTISYSGSSCVSSYYNFYATQGITAPTGSTVTMPINRCSGYAASVYVFVDWNNNGIYQTTEVAGSGSLAVSATSTIVSFTIPMTGITTNTNLHMRVFLGEPHTSGGAISPPCSAWWGESVDYYLNATCTTPALSVTPSSGVLCGTAGIPISVTATGATPTVYNWTPTAGLSPASGPSVTATPAATTTYTVNAFGPGACETTATSLIIVNPPITPVITAAGPTTFCLGQSVLLSETSGSGTLYQWYNGATAIPGATNSTYLAAPGVTTSYSVMVSTPAGCSGTESVVVTVLATPAAIITPVGPTTVCFPNTVQLDANTATGYTYRWFNASGVIGGAISPNYTATTGTYAVEITATSGCKDTSATVNVTINPKPVASATSTMPLTVCAYDNVTLTETSAGTLNYQWLNGNAVIPGATNGTYMANVPGSYDYRLQVSNSFGCRDTTAPGLFPVVVNAVPVSSITASGPLTICTGDQVTLSVPFVSGYMYQWYYSTVAGPGTAIGTGTTSSYTASNTGFYYATVTTPEGCTSTSEFSPAVVNAVTIPGITTNTSASFCWGSNVMLNIAISGSIPGVSFQWLRDSVGIPGAVGNSYTANLSGTYSCYINVSGGCLDTVAPVVVTVSPLPNPVITDSSGTLKTGNFYTSYQWFKNSIAIPGATTYRYHPTTTGEYTVEVADSNGCISISGGFPVTSVTAAVAGVKVTGKPYIYPNPATSKLFIAYGACTKAVIYSMEGKVMMEYAGAKEIDIADLAVGVYIISLFDADGNKMTTDKFTKE